MDAGFSARPRKEGTWTKLVIFVALYFLLFESILEAVLALYLYGNGQVDSKMTLSVVLSLVASFLSFPLVGLQSLVAWQYNNIGGFGTQKTVLHNVCTYVLRIDLMLWLATSVAGLVVAAQQVYCLPEGTDASYWRVGMSCAFHRATVIVSVVSMVTVCTMYCARELCDRPYDVSLLGIYRRQEVLRDGSILSGNSWDSEETLKNEILYLCRQHDGNGTGYSWSADPIANRVNCHPSIRHPAPVRLRPQLRVNTDPGSTYGEIVSGTTISPEDTMTRISPGSQSLASEFYPISRTSTMMTSQTGNELRALLSDTPVPKVPMIPKEYVGHKRQKSSLSSLRRFLPRSFPLSLPLSSDPQIRALADPNAASDVEKQVVTPNSMPKNAPQPTTLQVNGSQSQDVSPISPAQEPSLQIQKKDRSEGHIRTMTMNSADAPEVVPSAPKTPPKVRRSQTACPMPATRNPHYPHHQQAFLTGPQQPRKYPQSRRASGTPMQMPMNMHMSQHGHPPMRRSTTAQPTTNYHYPSRSPSYHFDPSQMPRHSYSLSQSPYHPSQSHPHLQQQYIMPQSTRWTSQRRFDPNRSMPPTPRRNDVELVYPSTRRPRSTTHGGVNGPLSCIMETVSNPRASVDEVQGGGISFGGEGGGMDQTTYRGANRTSITFY
ncbi:uncharacterized protein N7511_000584 [Penicillium nucicola]|uniref:uncharacterized protein n=1 Tax=Penicillium nucicola TaxID=1850975 RepID=UPI002545543F|nr:uncharacterized protein N7511_000584 [Penicillium nucicola]KAJ5775573.1 hypothetical protein N7511_000584 [Penicillium nucicola]